MRSFAALTLPCLACGLGSAAQAAAPVTEVDRWLAVGACIRARRAPGCSRCRGGRSRFARKAPSGAWARPVPRAARAADAEVATADPRPRDARVRGAARRVRLHTTAGRHRPRSAPSGRTAAIGWAVDAGAGTSSRNCVTARLPAPSAATVTSTARSAPASRPARTSLRLASRRRGLPVTVTAVLACDVGFNACRQPVQLRRWLGQRCLRDPAAACLARDGELTMVLANELSHACCSTMTRDRSVTLLAGNRQVRSLDTLLERRGQSRARRLPADERRSRRRRSPDALDPEELRHRSGGLPRVSRTMEGRAIRAADARPTCGRDRSRPIVRRRCAPARAPRAACCVGAAERHHARQGERGRRFGDPGARAVPARKRGARARPPHRAPPPPSGFASTDDLDRVPVARRRQGTRSAITSPCPRRKPSSSTPAAAGASGRRARRDRPWDSSSASARTAPLLASTRSTTTSSGRPMSAPDGQAGRFSAGPPAEETLR